jgi:hypothetical protein
LGGHDTPSQLPKKAGPSLAEHSEPGEEAHWHGIRKLMPGPQLSKILMFRNEELLQASNRASGKTLDTLLHITDQGKGQQETLTKLLGTGQADSALLKALSMVATVCLPASLVAVSLTRHQTGRQQQPH